MISMQYNIKLPADYNMDIIKNRVRDIGHKTDGFRDLEIKAYLIAEKGTYGNTQNEYAPFYVWNSTKGMNQFLLGGPFNNILNSFGWTPVNTWETIHTTIHKTLGKQYAKIEKFLIQPCMDLSELIAVQQIVHNKQTRLSDTTVSVIAYNPFHWELCNLIISKDKDYLLSYANEGLIYDVHHIS